MIIENPVRETYEEISTKYDDYCVLVIECDSKNQDFGSAKVLAYDKKLADLTAETLDLLDGDIGIFAYRTFTNFPPFGIGPIQVELYE